MCIILCIWVFLWCSRESLKTDVNPFFKKTIEYVETISFMQFKILYWDSFSLIILTQFKVEYKALQSPINLSFFYWKISWVGNILIKSHYLLFTHNKIIRFVSWWYPLSIRHSKMSLMRISLNYTHCLSVKNGKCSSNEDLSVYLSSEFTKKKS